MKVQHTENDMIARVFLGKAPFGMKLALLREGLSLLVGLKQRVSKSEKRRKKT